MGKRNRKFHLETEIGSLSGPCRRFFEENPLFTIDVSDCQGDVRVFFNSTERAHCYMTDIVMNPANVLANAKNSRLEIVTPTATLRIATDEKIRRCVRVRRFHFDSFRTERLYSFEFSEEMTRNEFVDYARTHRMVRVGKAARILKKRKHRPAIADVRGQERIEISGSGKTWTVRILNCLGSDSSQLKMTADLAH